MNKIFALFSLIVLSVGCNWGNSGCPNCSCDKGYCESNECLVESCDCSCKN